jgi:hypothetical protein
MSGPFDIAWALLKQMEIQDLENSPYSENPYSMQSTQPEPVQSVNPMGPAAPPPVGSSGRLQYLYSKSMQGTLTPEEHRELLMLGGM